MAPKLLPGTNGKKSILYCDPAHTHAHNTSFTGDYRLWPAFFKSPMWKKSQTYAELIPRVEIRMSEGKKTKQQNQL